MNEGTSYTHSDIKNILGVHVLSGIAKTTANSNVVLSTSEEVTSDNPYKDVWLEKYTKLKFTGSGKQGDQKDNDINNLILDKANTLHVFEINIDSKGIKEYIYRGIFEYQEDSMTIENEKGSDDLMRKVYKYILIKREN